VWLSLVSSRTRTGGGLSVAVPPELEDELWTSAIRFAMLVRDDVSVLHRELGFLSRLELEQVCCVLAAMVNVSLPISEIVWWSALAAD
jgi:hypothetical protein